jgi:hypothetical protein
MGNQETGTVRWRRASAFSLTLLVTAASFAGSFASPVAAQSNGGRPPAPSMMPGPPADPAADSIAEALAKADSARAALVQPPGSYDGVRASDVVKVPFQLFGATLALGAAAVGGTYLLADKLLLKPAGEVRSYLRDYDVDTRVASFGNRSWPGIVFRYQGLAPFYAEAGYSLRQYQHYAAGFEVGDDATGANVMGRYRRLRQPHFWGLGPNSLDENRSDFSQDAAVAGAFAWWTPDASPLRLSGGVAYENNRVVGRGRDAGYPDTDDVFPESAIFGLDERTEFMRVDGSAKLDLTHFTDLQQRGFSLQGEWQYYDGLKDTDASFHRVAADARAFVPASERQLFALRLLAEDHVGVKGSGVPFTHLAELGDDHGLRGYSGRRFRDNASLAAQLEWRYQVYWHPGFPNRAIEGFAFTDAGSVGPSVDAIRWDDVRFTPGIGLRYVQAGEGKAEAYLSRGDGRWRLGAAFGRTF